MATGPWHQARRAEQVKPQAAFQLRQEGLQATTSHRECLRSSQGLPKRLHPIRQAGSKLPRLRLPRCCYRMKSVAVELGVHEHTVGKWRRRFLKDRCDGLLDE